MSRVAVGTNDINHLHDLVITLRLRANKNQVAAYRELLQAATLTK